MVKVVLKVLGRQEPCCPNCNHNNAMLSKHDYTRKTKHYDFVEVRVCRDCGYTVDESAITYRPMQWDEVRRTWVDEEPTLEQRACNAWDSLIRLIGAILEKNPSETEEFLEGLGCYYDVWKMDQFPEIVEKVIAWIREDF